VPFDKYCFYTLYSIFLPFFKIYNVIFQVVLQFAADRSTFCSRIVNFFNFYYYYIVIFTAILLLYYLLTCRDALESKRREAARVKVEEAETRERAAAAAHASISGGKCIGQAAARWQTDPVTEGAEELTIEMAIQLEEQAAARRSEYR